METQDFDILCPFYEQSCALPSNIPTWKHDFHNCTVHLDTIKVLYLPTDAQESRFKKNIKIYMKTVPTCFGSFTIIKERII